MLEAVASVRKVLILANSKKGTNVPDFTVPRPNGVRGDDGPAPATGAELAAFIGTRKQPRAGSGVIRYKPKGGPS